MTTYKNCCLLAVIFVSILCPHFASGETPVLRWGGDATGGVPFVFLDPSDPTRTIGYEVDVANALARELGMKAEFVQNQWDGLIPGLIAKSYDIVVNAVEVTADRKEVVNFSDPYFFSFEQLTVRRDSYDISTLADLKGRSAGTIVAAVAERILNAEGGINVLGYESQTTLYEDLANGRIDAVLLDQPAALYYGGIDRRLKNLPKNFGEFSYGVCVRKEDGELLRNVNTALRRLIKTGELRHIYERWGVWNETMAAEFHDDSPEHFDAVELQNYMHAMGKDQTWQDKLQQYLSYLPLLGKGALVTLQLSLLSMLFAIGLGMFLALTRLYAPRPFPSLATFYVEFIRGTPLLIQLFFIYYGLPNIGIKLEPFVAAVLALSLNYGAYEAEVYRAGILAIPKSQAEAALALNMSRWQALVHVLIPQAIRIVIPPVTNDFVSLLKDSSLVSIITMVELTRVYSQLASTYYDYLGIGFLTAMLYLLLGLPFVRLSRYAEERFSGYAGTMKKGLPPIPRRTHRHDQKDLPPPLQQPQQ